VAVTTGAHGFGVTVAVTTGAHGAAAAVVRGVGAVAGASVVGASVVGASVVGASVAGAWPTIDVLAPWSNCNGVSKVIGKGPASSRRGLPPAAAGRRKTSVLIVLVSCTAVPGSMSTV